MKHSSIWASQVALVVKNPSANTGDRETCVRSLSQEDPLEEGMATHSSILAWRIPWAGRRFKRHPMAGDTRDTVSIPESGRSSGGGYGNSLQYSCLENPMDRGAWQATVHRVAQSQTGLKWLSMTLLVIRPASLSWCFKNLQPFGFPCLLLVLSRQK